MKKEPIRHHYIPQFILRNFCIDEDEHLIFVDAKTKKQSKEKVRDLFMERNLYRDTINDENPVKIEEDFARFENEVARIIKEKFLDKEDFSLNQYEHEKLKLFFALMAFRSKSTKDLFKKKLSKESKKLYSDWQDDKNFEDFWKRNLGKLVKCRSWEDIKNNEEIDIPIKLFFKRDVLGLFGKYICLVEPKDVGEFVLSDCYPVAYKGICNAPLGCSFEIGIFDICTVSPNRAILIASVGSTSTKSDVLPLRPLVLNEPIANEKNELIFRVKKLYPEEVEAINNMIIKHAKIGYVFKGKKQYMYKKKRVAFFATLFYYLKKSKTKDLFVLLPFVISAFQLPPLPRQR